MLKISNLRYEILRDVIISDFSLQLRAGEVKTLFGPSGCVRYGAARSGRVARWRNGMVPQAGNKRVFLLRWC